MILQAIFTWPSLPKGKLKKLPTGLWGNPVNMGSVLNTPYNEAFPRVSDDERTLYFSSKGHNSMGGYDIFKSEWDTSNNVWGEPVNIGFPINTPDDNMNFTLAKNQHDGYISMWRKDGLGDLDIYKIIFNDVDGRKTILHGMVSRLDSSVHSDVFVSIRDFYNSSEIEKIKRSAKNKFVFALDPGKYTLLIESSGYDNYKEDIDILGKNEFKEEIIKNISLYKSSGSSDVKGKSTPQKKPAPQKNAANK